LKSDPEEHHVALTSLFEILDVGGRADLMSDIMQELERQKQHLDSCAAIRHFPGGAE
jgi:cell division protein ZapD